MGSQTSENDWKPAFYVGQHESKRVQPVTDHTVWQAYACEVSGHNHSELLFFSNVVKYNMLTAPITNDYFHSRVLTLLSSHLINLDAGQPSDDDRDYDFDLAVPTIPALSQFDSHLSPRETTSHLFAVVSPWIDLCSPDPLIASISRQTLELEIAYAAFCGVENVIITGPRIHHGNLHGSGLTLYARAIHGALSIGTRLQIHIQLPMIDHPDFESDDEIDHLVRFAREEYLDNIEQSRSRKAEYFGTWDAWNIIRTVCKYNSRLYVGKKTNYTFDLANHSSEMSLNLLGLLEANAAIFPHFNETLIKRARELTLLGELLSQIR